MVMGVVVSEQMSGRVFDILELISKKVLFQEWSLDVTKT